MNTLTDIQKNAIKKMNIKAKIHSKNLMHLIVIKFVENNINVDLIPKIINFIKEKSYITTMIPFIGTKSIQNENIFEIIPKYYTKYCIF